MDLFPLTKIVAALVLPPGGIVLALLFGLGVRPWYPRTGTALLIAASVALGLLSIAPFSEPLVRWHEADAPLALEDPRLADAQAIVVLGGGRQPAPEYGGETVSGKSLQRVRYAARLQRRTRLPIAVTGGVVFSPGTPEAELMARVLRDELGARVQWVESRSRNTEENARFTAEVLAADGIARIVLVTHASHMPRAAEMFADQGFAVLAAPTAFAARPARALRWWDWLPSGGTLARNRVLLHELLGRLWYRLRRA